MPGILEIRNNRNGKDEVSLMKGAWENVIIGIDGYPELDYQGNYLIAGGDDN